MKDDKESGSPPPDRKTPEGLILSFLAGARRRKLIKTALIFLFAAAAVNEGMRWSAVLLRERFGIQVPNMDLGIFFFIVIFAGALMRTRLENVAALADRKLGFQDRLTSFMDFRRRSDLEPPLLAAQARETAAALRPVELKKTVPIHPALLLGPFLFALSFTYTVIFFKPYSMIFVSRGDGSQAVRRAVGEGPLTAAHTPAESGQPVATGDDPSGDDGLPEETGEPQADIGAEEPSSPLAFGEEGETGEIRHGNLPSGGMSSLLEEIRSTTVGTNLSDVVSPSLAETPLAQEKVIGRMTYRIVPEQLPAGEGSDGTATASSPVEFVIDYDTIPERFRALVKNYFSILGERSVDVSKRDSS